MNRVMNKIINYQVFGVLSLRLRADQVPERAIGRKAS